MWGYIITESNTLNNFNCGFSTYKSDILVHLSQWQYWWWFWFSIFWALYFFIIIRLMTKRTFQFNPVLNTSLRGHGKWGDFLVAIIPLSWCGNILVNSNFILRMIEWQNESSLFTIRVQGKQWYWVYKIDATAAQNIMAAPKNIGHNRWFVTTPSESYLADTYYQALNLGTQLEYKKLYYKLSKDAGIVKQDLNDISQKYFSTITSQTNKTNLSDSHIFALEDSDFSIESNLKKFDFIKSPLVSYYSLLFKINPLSSHYDFNLIDETQNYAANIREKKMIQPLYFVKSTINKHIFDTLKTKSNTSNMPILFNILFTDAATLEQKISDNELVWGFKQKKYKRLQKFKFSKPIQYDSKTFKKISTLTHSNARVLKSQLVQTFNDHNTQQEFNYHQSIKYNRHRHELVPVNLARRLLRTKRTLVLPAHVNLTVITNSYDVVHSWFIPGLGLKLDCVPGRSTHHSFYIDNIGFYYGQCAEICGRYHHHMPIRICALPFEHFLVWWQKKGLRRMHRVNFLTKNAEVDTQGLVLKYKW